MLSSMTPTIVLDSSGAPLLVTGAAGGAYIITAVAHQIVSLFDYHRSLGEAMAVPQFHHQDVPDSLLVEQVPCLLTHSSLSRKRGRWSPTC